MLRLEKVKLADGEVTEAEERTSENKEKAEARLKERLGVQST